MKLKRHEIDLRWVNHIVCEYLFYIASWKRFWDFISSSMLQERCQSIHNGNIIELDFRDWVFLFFNNWNISSFNAITFQTNFCYCRISFAWHFRGHHKISPINFKSFNRSSPTFHHSKNWYFSSEFFNFFLSALIFLFLWITKMHFIGIFLPKKT